MSPLRPDQIERYARHILLPQVGGRGQQRLLAGRVLVVGAGGLGAPVIQYLSAAGVGTLEVIDDDVVDLTNLQRQVIHATPDVGKPKVESARETVAALNSDVTFVAHHTRLNAENIVALLERVDVVVDGSDNFPTRYLLNDAAYLAGKPLVSGAILRFEGQVTVYRNDRGENSPCLRCLFPEPPSPGLVPTCAEAGIFGAVAGVIGSLQAIEVLKLLLGGEAGGEVGAELGESLAGRLLILDALTMSLRTVKLHRNRECALNGDAPTIRRAEMIPDGPACLAPPRPAGS